MKLVLGCAGMGVREVEFRSIIFGLNEQVP